MSLSFSECMQQLLSILDVSGSKLAKAINIDPSLVNKWVNQKRIPPVHSNYINEIANYLSRNIVLPAQERKLKDIARCAGILYEEKEIADSYILIKNMLLKAYDCSINQYKSFKNQRLTYNNPIILPNHINTGASTSDESPVITKNKYNDTLYKASAIGCNSVVIQGQKQILNNAINMLNAASKTVPVNNLPILLAYNAYVYSPNFSSMNAFRNAIDRVLEKGWQVICIIRLNDNVKNTTEIIESLMGHLTHGLFYPYLYKGIGPQMITNELIIVPGHGALLCFTTEPEKIIDSSLFFNNPEILNILSKHFNRLLSISSPLMHTFPYHTSTAFQAAIVDFEVKPGNRYSYRDNLGSISIPIELYKKYIQYENSSNIELSERILYHQRELDAFYINIQNYCYRDIYTKEAIERLINTRKYSSDRSSMYFGKEVCVQDIIDYINNIIKMLKNYDNYEMALIDSYHAKKIPWSMMTIKENTSACFTALRRQATDSCSRCSNEANFIVTESDVLRAYVYNFNELWKQIPRQNKDKSEVILWLEEQITRLR